VYKLQNKIKIILGIIAVFIVLIGIGAFMAPKTNTLFNYTFPAEPNKYYYEEITLPSEGTLQIDLESSNGNLLWYVMNCNADTWVQEGSSKLYELTYKSGLEGGNSVSDSAIVEAGTYTFVWVQTSDSAGEIDVSAKVSFNP
jgi:hypothetical protein